MKFLHAFLIFTSCVFACLNKPNNLEGELDPDKTGPGQRKIEGYIQELDRITTLMIENAPQNQEAFLTNCNDKLRHFIVLNLSFAQCLKREPDEAIIDMLMKSFQKLDFTKRSSYQNFDKILSSFYRKIILLVGIFQKDCDILTNADEKISIALNSPDTKWLNNLILGKPLLYYLFFCNELPSFIASKLRFLEEEIKKPQNVKNAALFCSEVIPTFAEFLPPEIGPRTRIQELIMPFCLACRKVYRTYLRKKFESCQLLTSLQPSRSNR